MSVAGQPTAAAAGDAAVPEGSGGRTAVAAGWRWPLAVLVVTVTATLFPLLRAERHDSLPLSNYPMFTAARGETADFRRAIGVTADDAERALPPQLIGGSVEVVHAARTLTRAIDVGTADALCAEIAARVSAAGLAAVEVLVVTERYDIVAALRADEPMPLAREIHARCPVVSAP